MLGGPNFDSIEGYEHELLGKLLYSVFLFTMIVVMINFIVAILSSTYENYVGKVDSLFVRDVIDLRSRHGNGLHNTNWAVSNMVPLNLVSLLLYYPLHRIFCKNKELVRKLLMIFPYIAYILIALILLIPLLLFVGIVLFIILPFLLVFIILTSCLKKEYDLSLCFCCCSCPIAFLAPIFI